MSKGRKPSSLDEPLTERRFSELLELKLEIFLDRKLTPLISRIIDLEKKYADLKVHSESTVVNRKLEEKVTFLEDQQAKQDLLKRQKNFIVKGVPESATNLEASVLDVAAKINVTLDNKIKSVFRLGKIRDDGSSRPILVKSCSSKSREMLTNAKKLREIGGKYEKVYIDRDLPPVLAKELGILRKRAYDWRKDHPDDTAYVKNGKLFINKVEVDQVKLT